MKYKVLVRLVGHGDAPLPVGSVVEMTPEAAAALLACGALEPTEAVSERPDTTAARAAKSK